MDFSLSKRVRFGTRAVQFRAEAYNSSTMPTCIRTRTPRTSALHRYHRGSTGRQPPHAARRQVRVLSPYVCIVTGGPGAGPPFSCTDPAVARALPRCLVSSAVSSQTPARPPARNPGPPAVTRVTWAQAQPIVNRLEEALPESLRAIPAAERARKGWPEWIDGQRRALEARIAQGDVDSVVNLMLFGTSFTSEPRITARLLSDLNQKWTTGDRSVQETLARHYQQRAADLVNAVWAAAGTDARLQDVKRVLTARGHSLDTATGQRAAIQDLLASVARVREEAAALAEELEAQRRAKDSTAAFAERSRVFRTRGLSADSSVLTQFAVDRGVCALGDRGVLAARSVNRIAIVGPGLDFVDKQEGFDFYDPQSLQPFTLADSLLTAASPPGAPSPSPPSTSARASTGTCAPRFAAQRAARRLSPGPAVEFRQREQRGDGVLETRRGPGRTRLRGAGAWQHAGGARAWRGRVARHRPAHPAGRRQYRV